MKGFFFLYKYSYDTTLRILIILLCIQMFFACNRRPLTYDNEEGVPIRIELDWSALNGKQQPLYVKALFFPVDRGKAIERYVKYEGQEIKIPPGIYNIIVYTWRTNADAQTVQFRGDTYDSFEAYTQEKYQRLPLNRSQTSIPVVPQPDIIYSWNSSTEPVEINYSDGIKNQSTSSRTLTAAMQSIIQEYDFEINICNAEEMNTMYAVLTHVRGSRPLGSGNADNQKYGLLAQDVIRIGENEGITTYRCKVTAFCFHDTNKSFIINITNKTGNGQQVEIDITKSIDDRNNGVVSAEEPIVVAPKGDPVIVEKTEVGGGGFIPPTLDDWEKKDESIKL